MVVLALPVGRSFGWGNCGRWITREMARLTEVHLLPPRLRPADMTSEIEYAFFEALTKHVPELSVAAEDLPQRVDMPVFGAVTTPVLLPIWSNPHGRPTVGYTFFEHDKLSPQAVENCRRYYDCLLTGSSFCTNVLREHGVPSGTLIQGVDRETFFPLPEHRRMFPDRFVIFSGGKFELRKGHDLVTRAVKVLMDRHRDVLLAAAWHNYETPVQRSMIGSPYVKLPEAGDVPEGGDYRAYVTRFLATNGVDVSRVILLAKRPQEAMAGVYHETDVGLFPNRCESGTNLVLMEYMACGKPAVASWTSGHRDIITDGNCLVIRASKPMILNDVKGVNVTWDDPDLDETIDKLEWAYQNRDSLRAIGVRAGQDLAVYSWARTAEELLARLSGAKPLTD